MYSHALLMRNVSPVHKLLLVAQIQIAAFVCRLNAQLTAGQDTVIDILMNAAGLYILNEIDEIFLMLFQPCRKPENDEECVNNIKANVRNHDRVFGLIICSIHFIYMLTYMITQTSNISRETESTMQSFLDYGPFGYSTPIFIGILYIMFYGYTLGLSFLKKDLLTCNNCKS